MADILHWRLQFIGTNGDYVAGDVLEIYYDPASDPTPNPFTSTPGITVKKNTVVISSGSDVAILGAGNSFNATNYNPLICNWTSRVRLYRIEAFPYVAKLVDENYPSCSIDPEPPVCDLAFSGVAIVTNATGSSNYDGSIQVTATSSKAIRFKINSDFAYEDGTGNSTGFFNGLAPGDYRIYARDEVNCASSLLVTVGISELSAQFGEYWRCEYDDYVGNQTRISIFKRGYTGSVTEVCGSGDPLNLLLRGEAMNDKFIPVISTQAVVSLTSMTNFQFGSIYTNDPKEFVVHYYKDFNNTLPPFVPAVLADFLTWQNDASSTSVWAVNTVPDPDDVFAFLSGNSMTARWYIDYAFVAGQTYTFSYSFRLFTFSGFDQGAASFANMIIDITSENFANLGVNFIVAFASATGEQIISSSITFVAPENASRISIRASQNISSGGYNIKDFQNDTPSNSGVDQGFELIWKGNVLPKQYQEDYKAPPYYIQINATDGLADLDKIPFVKEDGQLYFGVISKIKLLAFCLSKTTLELPIRVAINMYAVGMDSTDEDDPLDQGYIDFDSIYISTDSPTLLYVINHILKPYGARLVQFYGRWNVVRIEEMRSLYDYREFSKDGDYIGNGSYNPVKSVTPPSLGSALNFVDADQNMEIQSGYGKVRVKYNLGLSRNILRNGDFRLKSEYNPNTQKYDMSIDTFGFQLITDPNEVLTEGYESLQDGNVAYLISGSKFGANTGNSYILSGTYPFKMGSTNTLRVYIKYKLPIIFSPLLQVMDLPYQKVRIAVKFGSKYLNADGSWSDSPNIITFYATKFNEYVESEIIATQPDPSYATADHDFNVILYKSYYQHYEYSSTAALKAAPLIFIENYPTFLSFPTIGSVGITYTADDTLNEYYWNGGGYTQILSTEVYPGPADGTRTEAFDGSYVNFYKLETTTDPENGISLVRPDDYDSVKNPRQWRKVFQTFPGFEFNDTPFWIDKIMVEFLDNGAAPIDTIIHDKNAEPNNEELYESEVIFGSLSDVIKTGVVYTIPNGLNIGPGIDVPLPDRRYFNYGDPVEITQSILSAKLIYRGYIRSEDGDGYELWKRDAVAESATLHGILATTFSAQYKRPLRKITGSIYGSDYFGFVNVLREVNDNNRLYLPMSMTIYDKRNKVNGEFIELIDITQGAGSDGSGEAPFSSGFTTGFGGGYD